MIKPLSIVEHDSVDKNMTSASFEPLDALDNLPYACFVTDPLGHIFFANQAASSLVPRSFYHMKNKTLFDILGFSDDKQVRLAKIIEDGGIAHDEAVIGEEKGRRWHGGVSIMPFDAHNQRVLVTLLPRLAHDEVQSYHLSGARRAANMAEILAHEVKNPLAGIRGSAQLLELNAPESDKHLISIICDECDRIRRLLDDMEAFSNPRSDDFKSLNIHDILLHVIRLVDSSLEGNIEIEQVFDPSLPEVIGDRNQLVQVFLNIVKNAADAIAQVDPPEGGRIVIRTRYRHGERLRLQDSDLIVEIPICVEISDNGGGIDAAYIGSIFEPFVTSKIGGKGLGLALVHKIVNDHSGRIVARNGGAGACFEVYLPLTKQNIGASEKGGNSNDT